MIVVLPSWVFVTLSGFLLPKDVMNLRVEDRVKLDQLLVVTGNTITPTASVTLMVDEQPMTGSGVGNGLRMIRI